MIDVYEYILLDQNERQKHLKLDEPCIERGGTSTHFCGLLADRLETTIPKGRKIQLCHACHNGKCSNPHHLYWGTPSENSVDRIANDGITLWDRMVAKYGLEEAKRIQSSKGQPSAGGKGNKGIPKSEEHRRKISEALRNRHAAMV